MFNWEKFRRNDTAQASGGAKRNPCNDGHIPPKNLGEVTHGSVAPTELMNGVTAIAGVSFRFAPLHRLPVFCQPYRFPIIPIKIC